MTELNGTRPNIVTASAWRKKGQEAEAKRERKTVQLTLPSGAVVEACRPPLETWMATGKLPFSLVRQFLTAHPDEDTEERALAAINEDQEAALKSLLAVQQIVTAAVVRPRIVENPQGEDEIAPADVPDEDFFFIYRWVIAGAASLPVETEGGSVSMDALSTFCNEGGGRGAAAAGTDREQVRDDTERVAGHS